MRDATRDISSILYIPAVLLFGYIIARTRRPTSVALFYLVLSYTLAPLLRTPVYVGAINITAAIMGFRFLGPAIAAAAFYYRDIGFSLELVIYGVAFALVAFFVALLIATPMPSLVAQTSILFMVAASTLGLSTSGYTYGRWKKTRSRATLALFMFLVLSVASYVLDVTSAVGVSTDPSWYYAAVLVSAFSLMFFNLSAFFALDWKALALLPAIIIVPEVIYVSMTFPRELTTMPYFALILAVTGTVQFVLPLILYMYLWRIMSRAKQPSAGRPFLLALGAIAMLLAMAGGSPTSNPFASVLVLGAYLCWWLGVTGKLESFTKWYFASAPKEKAELGRL
jgi:hypothetical protein